MKRFVGWTFHKSFWPHCVYIYISYFCVKLFSSFYNAQKGALKVTGESTRKPIKTFHLYLKYVKLY